MSVDFTSGNLCIDKKMINLTISHLKVTANTVCIFIRKSNHWILDEPNTVEPQ